MRKNVFGRQFKRDHNERKALFKGLMSSLILQEQITTTEEKAKAIKAHTDKLVTKAKKGGINAQRLLEESLTSGAVGKLMNDIAPRFANRQGGYTRIIRKGRRFNDNATMVLMEWVELGRYPSTNTRKIKADAAPSENIDEVMSDVVYGKKGKSPAKRDLAPRDKKKAAKKTEKTAKPKKQSKEKKK